MGARVEKVPVHAWNCVLGAIGSNENTCFCLVWRERGVIVLRESI